MHDRFINTTHHIIFNDKIEERTMLERYKDILSRAKSAKLETLTAWYSFFRMKEDPFLSQISSEELEYFVDREDIVDSIVYDVGVASRGIPIITLIVGPYGSGKTSILQYIQNVLAKLKVEYPNEYSFDGELFTSDDLFQVPEETEEKEEVQLWTRVCKKSLDYLFVDDAKPAHIKTIIREFIHTRLKVFGISPLDYEDVLSNLPVAPKTQFLRPFNLENTVQMLNMRIKRALLDKSSEVSIFDLFDNEALEMIHKYAMGVPALILKCASRSLSLLQDYASASDILSKIKATSEIASKACKITKCFQAYTEFENISRTKMEVLQQILKSGKTPTEISSILKKDRTTISRHLGDLRELGLVDFRPRGRESVYEATEPVKVRFEIVQMPKGGWEIAST